VKNVLLICRYCDDEVLTTDRVRDPDLESLKRHLATHHSDVLRDARSSVCTAVLKDFQVSRLPVAATLLLRDE
jgi:hypothetical protein